LTAAPPLDPQLLDDPSLRRLPVQDGYPVLGQIWLCRKLGEGGMGAVYLGFDPQLQRRVAVKCLQADLARDPRYLQRFLEEGRAAARLQHPHVVGVLGVGEEHGLSYLVMEFVEGESVRDWLGRRSERVSERQALAIVIGAARGLAHAHGRGVVHRDVKPENLLVSREGQVKVADLGLAKPLTDAGRALRTETGAIFGTPAYMPPEQFLSSRDVGCTADVYALGAVLYALLAGQDAYRGHLLEILEAKRAGPFPDLAAVRPDVSAAVADWVARACAERPEERPADARQALRELQELARGARNAAGAGEIDGERVPARHRSRWIAGGVGALLLVGGAAWYQGQASAVELPWAEVLTRDPDPEVVTDPEARRRMLATGLPWRVRDRRSGIEMLLVPPGNYVRGASAGDGLAHAMEGPPHPLRVEQAFYLGRTEVTRLDWERYSNATSLRTLAEKESVGLSLRIEGEPGDSKRFVVRDGETGAHWRDPFPLLRDGSAVATQPSSPATLMTRDEAQGFCEHHGLRLPREAEWEYAARAGTTTRFWWGDDPALGAGRGNFLDGQRSEVGGFAFDDGHSLMAPVATFGANPWGFLDLLGNVQEWCSTDYERESYRRLVGNEPPTAAHHADPVTGGRPVRRGGSFMGPPLACRVSSRGHDEGPLPQFDVGFRVARDP
jgi:formylglycine-generating enzyme required for sulfatase activity